MKLLFFGRAAQSCGRTFPARDDACNIVEISGADLTLMPRRGVAVDFGRELRFLQFGISGHPSIAIAVREFKHAVVEGVESGERDELEFEPIAPSSRWNFAIVGRSSFAFQLNEGEQL